MTSAVVAANRAVNAKASRGARGTRIRTGGGTRAAAPAKCTRKEFAHRAPRVAHRFCAARDPRRATRRRPLLSPYLREALIASAIKTIELIADRILFVIVLVIVLGGVEVIGRQNVGVDPFEPPLQCLL